MLGERLKRSLSQTKVDYNLPVEYVISKFYELGYKVQHQKFNNTYLGCCPICHEGKSWGKKRRCYYIPDNNNIFCHNCGSSETPYNWIIKLSGMSDRELRAEIDEGAFDTYQDPQDDTPSSKETTLPKDCINLFDPVQLGFYENNPKVRYAIDYITGRRLNTAVNKPDSFYLSLKDTLHGDRLIIPFKDEAGQIIFYQSRKLFENDPIDSYISKCNSQKSIFGMDKITTDIDTVFIFEGPLDSCFIKNGLAVAGITKGHQRYTDLQDAQLNSLRFFKKIWVLDSQWLDETSRVKTESLLRLDENVFIWPEDEGKKYKDLNDMCISEGLDEVGINFILDNTICGNSSLMKYKLMMNFRDN